MKEVRYATKTGFLAERDIAKGYADLELDEPPPMAGNALVGVMNAQSWQLQGYIEDANGWLRKQSEEETQFCMGCHSNVGINVDQTFALAATNGSTDDVFVRLPAAFQQTASGERSPAIYRTNLAILEAAIAANPDVPVACSI